MSLPPSLNLSSHLSSHKYFFVCTLTVAAWDTLVLSPRTWKLWKTPGFPPLKVIFLFLRVLMPIEFIIVGVAFFDTSFTRSMCNRFYLFEPITTAFLLAAASAAHVIRIHAIYEQSKAVLVGLGSLFFAQVIITAVASGYYRVVPLDVGQGCIAGPKANWVGIYWVLPTLLYTTTFVLAIMRSLKSLDAKPLSPWKLMLRDGLNLYGAIALVNLVNMFFWFIIKPNGPADPIKTVVTSMAAVLTCTMTLRIILSVRGSLVAGGTFAGSLTASSASRGTHVMSGTTRSTGQFGATGTAPTYTLDDMTRGSGGKSDWYAEGADGDGRASIKGGDVIPITAEGVKITVDTEIEYDRPYGKK